MNSQYTIRQKQVGRFDRNKALAYFQQLQQARYVFANTIRVSKDLGALRGSNVGGYLRDSIQNLKENYKNEISRRLYVTVISRNDRGAKIERELRDGQSRADALADIKRELKAIRKRRREINSYDNPIHLLPNHFLSQCYKKKLSKHKAPKDNAEYVGIEIECITPANADLSQLWPFANYVNVGGDGSIEYGRNEEGTEVRVCLKRDEVRKVVPELLTALRKLGARVNRSCGLHVHLDQRNNANVEATYQKLVRAQSLLYTIVPQSRRDNRYCRRTRVYNFQDARRSGRYHAINASAYDRYQTIEVRLFGGTLDGDKIVNWIETLYGIADGGIVLRCPKSFDLAKRHWKLSEENIAWLKARQAKFAEIPLAPVAESEGEEAEHRPNVPESPQRRRGVVAVSQPVAPSAGNVVYFANNADAGIWSSGDTIQVSAGVDPSALQSGEIGRIEGVSFAPTDEQREIHQLNAYRAVVHPSTARELALEAQRESNRALSAADVHRAVEHLRSAQFREAEESIFRQLYAGEWARAAGVESDVERVIEENGGEENV